MLRPCEKARGGLYTHQMGAKSRFQPDGRQDTRKGAAGKCGSRQQRCGWIFLDALGVPGLRPGGPLVDGWTDVVEWWLCAHREMCDVLEKREWKWRLHGLREGKGDVGWDRQKIFIPDWGGWAGGTLTLTPSCSKL